MHWSGRFRSPGEPGQGCGEKCHNQRKGRIEERLCVAKDGAEAHGAGDDKGSQGGPARDEDEQRSCRVHGSGNVAEPLPPADGVEEWDGAHGSGELFDSDDEKGETDDDPQNPGDCKPYLAGCLLSHCHYLRRDEGQISQWDYRGLSGYQKLRRAPYDFSLREGGGEACKSERMSGCREDSV